MFDLRNTLIKMSVIQAACHGRDDIQPADVRNAFDDLSKLWDLQLNFISKKIRGRIDNHDQLSPKLLDCLAILARE